MSKISTSPRMNGASSASMEKVSTVIAGSSGWLPATTTWEKLTDGNGRMRAVTSPSTVTRRPSTAVASRSKSAR